MKKIIWTILFSFFSLKTISAQWEILNEGFKGSINTIDFVNENVGWIAGDNGTLIKTTDGGMTWNNISLNKNWHLGQIDFTNESTGWAIEVMHTQSGDSTNILITTNGGQSFSIQKQIANLRLNSIYIVDENNVYAVGNNKMYKTTNGGTEWIDISPNLISRNYNSMWFQNSELGVVVGSYNDGNVERGIILKTTNGGISWNEIIAAGFNSIYDLQFLNSSSGYFRANNDSITFLCKTVDMFSSWTIITQSSFGIGSYQYIDSSKVYAIIGDSTTTNNIMKSLDGGSNWQIDQSTPFWLNKICLINSLKGFILSDWFLLTNANGNNNWVIQKFYYPSLNDVFFTEGLHGIVLGGFMSSGRGAHGGGPVGNIFTTDDGGISWYINYSVDRILQSTSHITNMVGFCFGTFVQGPDRIYKTTDSGNKWNQLLEFDRDSIGYEFDVCDISFMNEQSGWVVGSYWGDISGAAILNTTDGGELWKLLWIDSTTGWPGLNSIIYRNTTGWTVGESGLMVKCTPQTGWVKQTSVTDLPLNKVFFSDENNGWIAGGYENDNDFQNILLKTINAGDSWEKIQNVPYLIKDIVFLDNIFGWAIGYDSSGVGGILKSTDGGSSWTIDTGNLPAKLNALYIKDGYGWAVGDNGLILRTTNAGPTWVENENKILPTEFILGQNYPNPFNPTTKIKYGIPIHPPLLKGEIPIYRDGGFVTLKVYDVLGREMATLVNEEKSPGVYEVEFDGKDLSSGIYFYQLKAGLFVNTKKMILLK